MAMPSTKALDTLTAPRGTVFASPTTDGLHRPTHPTRDIHRPCASLFQCRQRPVLRSERCAAPALLPDAVSRRQLPERLWHLLLYQIRTHGHTVFSGDQRQGLDLFQQMRLY
eukprot:6189607-Pleurochrysis_carterae.AAC.1